MSGSDKGDVLKAAAEAFITFNNAITTLASQGVSRESIETARKAWNELCRRMNELLDELEERTKEGR